MLLSACAIFFSIQHHFPEPDRQGEREKNGERGRNWRGDKETHSMDYTRTYTHTYAYTHAGTHCMSLCLISPAVYQGDQEFNTVKFPVDKTVFGESGPNECWAGGGGGSTEGDEKRMTWGRQGLIVYLILSFPLYHPLLIYYDGGEQLRLTDASDTGTLSFVCQERVEGLWWQFYCDSNWRWLLLPLRHPRSLCTKARSIRQVD